MLPTEKTQPKNDIRDLVTLIYGPPKIGKCLTGDTMLIDALSGGLRSIRDIVESGHGNVLTVGIAGQLVPATPSGFCSNGIQPVFRLTTQTGRTIRATSNHPFLTRDGWVPLHQLPANSRVAVVTNYKSVFGSSKTVKQDLYNVRAAGNQLDIEGNFLFDRIETIEHAGEEETFDLTIDESHCFVANDFVVHNSTFCSQADGALFLATEAGLNHLEVYQIPIATWAEFLAACSEIAKGSHEFRTICIDTIDNLYRFCVDHVLRKHNITHQSDLEYGKGYDLVNTEFQKRLTALSLLPYGLMMTSHSVEKEVKTRTGKETRIAPTLPNSARKTVLGVCDLILYAEMQEIQDGEGVITGYNRVVHTKPTTIYEAGDRSGLLPETLPLDYAAFAAAIAGSKTKPATTQPAAKSAATTSKQDIKEEARK